jgi:hypothetical protein
MSIELGEAFITISFVNKAKKGIEQAEKETMAVITAGEKKKQAEVNKTTGFFKRQGQSIAALGGNFNTFMGNTSKAFLGLSAMATVGRIGLNKLTTLTHDYAQAQLKAEAVSGTSTIALQKLSHTYSNLANIGLGQATSELSAFAQQIERAKMGFESPVNLMMGGVNFNKSTTLDSAIRDLRRNLGGRSTQEVSAFLERAGLSNDLLFVIKASSEELENFNSIPVLSKGQLQDIQGAGKSFSMLKQLINGLIKTSQAQIAPYLRVELQRLFKVISINKNKIVDFIAGTTKWISKFITATVRATGLIADFVSSLMSSKVGFLALAGGIGLIMARTKPLWWALSGIIILLEEIAYWRETGESPLAGFFEGVQKMYKILDDTVGVTNLLKWALIGLAGASILNGLTTVAGSLAGIAGMVGTLAKNPLVRIGIAAAVGGELLGRAVAKKITGRIEAFDEESNINPEMVKRYNTTQGVTPSSLPNRLSSPANQNSNMINNNQQFTFNIDGSNKNPNEIAKEVGGEIGRNYDVDMRRLNSLIPLR